MGAAPVLMPPVLLLVVEASCWHVAAILGLYVVATHWRMLLRVLLKAVSRRALVSRRAFVEEAFVDGRLLLEEAT